MQRSQEASRANRFGDFPEPIVLHSDLEGGTIWASTLAHLATRLILDCERGRYRGDR